MTAVGALVEDLTHDGSGVVRLENRVYFVDGALPGELVRFEPGKKRRGRFSGTLLEVIEPSAERVTPQCEYFGVCGGCVMQHLNGSAQARYKEKILFDNLSRIGRVSPRARMPMIQGPTSHYRRKARLGVKFVAKKGGVLVGFRERKSSFVTNLQRCITLDSRISGLLPDLRDLVSGLTHNDQIPQIEVAAGDERLAMIVRHLQPLEPDDEALLQRFSSEFSVGVYVQSGGMDTVRPLCPPIPEPLSYRLASPGVTLRFSPSDFIQVNAAINNLMVDRVVELMDAGPDDSILDLFCGLGNFTLPLARSGASLLGIESDPRLVRQASENAQLNGIANADFIVGDLYGDQPGRLIEAGGHPVQGFNRILLDPPRSGALTVITELVPELLPEKIIYVSCNPATLARDANELVNNQNYVLTSAGAIDMFPHTAHVESIALFERPR